MKKLGSADRKLKCRFFRSKICKNLVVYRAQAPIMKVQTYNALTEHMNINNSQSERAKD